MADYSSERAALEKRRKNRAEVDQNIAVINAVNGCALGQVVNISSDGFMIIGRGEIKESCLYQLNFVFAQPVGSVAELTLGAECLWLNETDAGEQFWAGFQVIDISESDNAILHSLSEEAD